MQNILNHNKFQFGTTLNFSDYWDFSLYLPQCGGGLDLGTPYDGCLAASIDTTYDECIDGSSIKSMTGYVYSKCRSKGIEYNNIGLTGMDNGLIKFNKYEITVEEFTELLTESVYTIDADDCTLKLNPVDGNNQIYNYTSAIVEHDGVRCLRLNGGFYQGFFADSDPCIYSVLPTTLGDSGWGLHFELKRRDFGNSKRTLNSEHPENKGIFFYIGTRTENKWIKYYDVDESFEKSAIKPPKKPNPYVTEEECNNNFDDCLYSDYYVPDYNISTDCGCKGYFKEPYMEEEDYPDQDKHSDIMETTDGHYLNEANVYDIETDNKFVLFDRSPKGLTVKTYQDGDTAVLRFKEIPNDENYFTLFNRGCNGITVNEYDEYVDKNGNKYDVYGDLYRNALGFQIKDDGSIGYKFFVKDCKSEEPDKPYKIESEFSNPGVVEYGKWTDVFVKILPVGKVGMRMMFFVNGKLRLVSRELPLINLRKLNDTPDKQESAPFNISLGGGTQGLCDVIYNDFMKIPEYIYPLEKEFGGTFVGYIKSFRFFECLLNFDQIRTL